MKLTHVFVTHTSKCLYEKHPTERMRIGGVTNLRIGRTKISYLIKNERLKHVISNTSSCS